MVYLSCLKGRPACCCCWRRRVSALSLWEPSWKFITRFCCFIIASKWSGVSIGNIDFLIWDLGILAPLSPFLAPLSIFTKLHFCFLHTFSAYCDSLGVLKLLVTLWIFLVTSLFFLLYFVFWCLLPLTSQDLRDDFELTMFRRPLASTSLYSWLEWVTLGWSIVSLDRVISGRRSDFSASLIPVVALPYSSQLLRARAVGCLKIISYVLK